ncbi:dnaJ [Raphidocelis subcapitata]|uniref:DnaJ n=1 Tax=Raphidocelis subcapitata TaxID=307507 RepID=A0A2V0PPZ2_9CHLO|nr:dnaJ [Raphidocelis subcapitata]|eukprot:GBF99265.1 dnaJ [Raphidocelis subcapitata]
MAPLLRVLLAIAASALAPPHGALASGPDVAALLREGDASFAGGAYSSAIRHYSDALEADSASALIHTKRAAAYISARQLAAALRDLDAAVAADGAFTQGYLNRGKLHRQLCNVEAARADLEAVTKIKPGHKAAVKELENLAALEAALAALDRLPSLQPDAARAAVAAVLDAAPDCTRAQVAEAEMEFGARNYEQVVAATGRLLKASPGHLQALVLRGRAYFYLNDPDLAKRHFGEALKYDPDYGPARKEFNRVKDLERRRQRAARAEAEGDLPESEAQLLAALAVDPAHELAAAELHYALCQLRRRMKNHRAALESCDAVLARDPSHRAAALDRVRLLFDLEEWQAAVNAARAAAQARQGDNEFGSLYHEAERRLKMSQRKDHYKTLGVARDADGRDIRRAYKRLAVAHHPDKAAPSERAAREAVFKEVAEAYEVLKDEEKRAAYDRGDDLDGGGGGGGGGWHGGWQGGHGFPGGGGGSWTFTF